MIVELDVKAPKGKRFTVKGGFHPTQLYTRLKAVDKSAPATVTIFPITGNGNNRVVFPEANIVGLPFFAADNDVLSTPETISETITQVFKSGDNFVWILNVTDSSETPIDWPDFNGGTLTVGEGAGVDIVAAGKTPGTLTTGTMNIPCKLKDDDNTVLPQMPNTGTMVSAFKPAYVVPVFDVGDSNMAVPFVLNVGRFNSDITAAIDWDSQSLNANDFWVAYVLTGFQGETSFDDDPNSELADAGATNIVTGGSIVYLEVHRAGESFNTATAFQDTLVHESGHAVAVSDSHDVTNGASRFISNYLRLIRVSTKPAS